MPQDGIRWDVPESTLVENSVWEARPFCKRRFLMDYGQAEACAEDYFPPTMCGPKPLKASSLSGEDLQKAGVGQEFTQDYEVLITSGGPHQRSTLRAGIEFYLE